MKTIRVEGYGIGEPVFSTIIEAVNSLGKSTRAQRGIAENPLVRDRKITGARFEPASAEFWLEGNLHLRIVSSGTAVNWQFGPWPGKPPGSLIMNPSDEIVRVQSSFVGVGKIREWVWERSKILTGLIGSRLVETYPGESLYSFLSDRPCELEFHPRFLLPKRSPFLLWWDEYDQV